MIDLNKPSQLFKILISLITILPFHLILLGSLFSGNIRNNLFNLFKTLLDNGIIGAYIILVLLYFFVLNPEPLIQKFICKLQPRQCLKII
jgi:hypothetical protein